MAQAVDHLLCKPKTLSSNPSPTKQTNKQKSNGADSQELIFIICMCMCVIESLAIIYSRLNNFE
jgi:hypothetical protein